jgi:mono/diheme cytochrome c family protein
VTRQDDDSSAPDGIGRWRLGGLVAGGVIVGLLVGAYAIGYHRGEHSGTPQRSARSPSTTAATATSSTPVVPPKAPRPGPVAATPTLIAAGKALYTSNSCSGCHSLSGAAGAGPTFKGLAGGTTTLSNGTRVTADDAYLERSIADPDAQIVKGYTAGLMSSAIASFDLAQRPDDVRALVAFIKSQK